MRLAPIVVALTIATGSATAEPLQPATSGTLDGLPIAEAMASIDVLGEWNLPQGGIVRLVRVVSGQVLCDDSHETDTDYCDLQTLYLSAFEAPSVPMDHILFRLPKRMNWRLAATPPQVEGDKFMIQLAACTVEHKSGRFSLRPDVYELRVGEGVAKSGHYFFTADLKSIRPAAGTTCTE